MESLKSFKKEDVTDLGQEYWIQKSRMERCKGLGLVLSLVITVVLLALSYALAVTTVWADSLTASLDHDRWLNLIVGISFLGALGTFFGGIAFGGFGIENARDQRRRRRELPPRPENYSPEMAEKAFHVGVNIDVYNKILKQTQDSVNSLHRMKSEIEHGLDFTQNYRDAMSEGDIETLTLRGRVIVC